MSVDQKTSSFVETTSVDYEECNGHDEAVLVIDALDEDTQRQQTPTQAHNFDQQSDNPSQRIGCLICDVLNGVLNELWDSSEKRRVAFMLNESYSPPGLYGEPCQDPRNHVKCALLATTSWTTKHELARIGHDAMSISPFLVLNHPHPTLNNNDDQRRNHQELHTALLRGIGICVILPVDENINHLHHGAATNQPAQQPADTAGPHSRSFSDFVRDLWSSRKFKVVAASFLIYYVFKARS